ncbi:DUF1365 domain-containing protein [Halothiobacillus sp. DCM-1]|uniref:DUF1365 domain-containing protein n=1 Tax=Halothiobacillus sp. DCM-1 TaxID=3112558 RepID=UPI003246A887
MNGSRLYLGAVMHQRLTEPAYRFNYRVFSLLVDLDDLEANFPANRWLSADRFNLFSVYQKDLGSRKPEASLRDWITRTCAAAGCPIEGGKVLINTYPRLLGYQFNPLSLWYCHNAAGALVAINAEVSNTFGEHHHYLLHDGGRPLSNPFAASADKVFHVSPFLPMNMRYHFRLNHPAERLSVVIRETRNAESGEEILTLIATHHAHAQPLTDRNLWLAALRIPLLTLKVILLIHWQALKIWRRGGIFHRSPPKPATEVSSCPSVKSEP